MTTYRTSLGDMVDWIAWRHYGDQIGTTEAILSANRDLADYGPELPANLVMTIPDVELPKVRETVKLWN